MYLILGLGNPGPQYETTRHNIGFLIVDSLSEKYKIAMTRHANNSVFGSGEIEGLEATLAKPLTYMNESGRAARKMTASLSLEPERMIVVHDDVDLELGKIKIKREGGDAGQRGIRSIIAALKTDRFVRIRCGVGRPTRSADMIDYVLSPFDDGELEQVNDTIESAIRLIEQTLRELDRATHDKEEES